MLHSVVRPAVASVVALAILSRPLLPTACADVCSIFSPFAGQFALESQAVVAHTIKRVWVGGFVINLFRVDASWALPQASTPAHARTRTSAHTRCRWVWSTDTKGLWQCLLAPQKSSGCNSYKDTKALDESSRLRRLSLCRSGSRNYSGDGKVNQS